MGFSFKSCKHTSLNCLPLASIHGLSRHYCWFFPKPTSIYPFLKNSQGVTQKWKWKKILWHYVILWHYNNIKYNFRKSEHWLLILLNYMKSEENLKRIWSLLFQPRDFKGNRLFKCITNKYLSEASDQTLVKVGETLAF